MCIAVAVFGLCEDFAQSLQCVKYSAAGAKRASELLSHTLANLRNESSFEQTWQDTRVFADQLNLKEAKTHRVSKLPFRYEQAERPAALAALDAKSNLQKDFFAVIDRIAAELNCRFNQSGFDHLVRLERTLVSAAFGQRFSNTDVKERDSVHACAVDIDRLKAQLLLLSSVVPPAEQLTVEDIATALKRETSTVRKLLDQVIRLVILLLVVPALVATRERSFSALRRVKIFLHNRMTQKRLAHLILLHVHKEKNGPNSF